jgi:peptidoglycan hydrolase-like protein with peptidoglycan-binding domain
MARHLSRRGRRPRSLLAIVLGVVLAAGLAAGLTAAPAGAATATLKIGMRGAAVTSLQRRLAALHYDPGAANGVFGSDTFHAVVAFQKVNGLARDGVVGPKTSGRLARPIVPRPRAPRAGGYVEIDLTRQVLYLARGSAIVKIVDVSSGSGKLYTVDGRTARAVTPTGHFHIYRKINAWRTSRLGKLWRPAYFTGGFAIHGSYSVPSFPASHGCVRVTISVMNRLYNQLPIGTPVFVYH